MRAPVATISNDTYGIEYTNTKDMPTVTQKGGYSYIDDTQNSAPRHALCRYIEEGTRSAPNTNTGGATTEFESGYNSILEDALQIDSIPVAAIEQLLTDVSGTHVAYN